MITASLRTGLLKWIVAVLLAAMVLGAAAMAYWLPVQGYAAEFEGGSALAEADAAAAQLNRVFSSEIPASVHVVAHPPGYFRWLIWAGIGLLVVFVLVIYRELFKPGASDQ